MFDQPVAEGMRPCCRRRDPAPRDEGVIRVASGALFAEPDSSLCRRFVQRAFAAEEIEAVVIAGSPKAGNGKPAAELRFDARQYSRRQVLEHVAALLAAAPNSDDAVALPPACTARDGHGVVRYHRYGPTGYRLAGAERAHRRDQAQEPGALSQGRPVRGHRARADERPRSRSLRDQLARLPGQDRVRPAPAAPGADHRDPRRCFGQCGASRPARSARSRSRYLHGRAAGRRDRPVRDAGAAAGVGGDFRLYRDPELPPRLRGARQRAAPRCRPPRLGRHFGLSRDLARLPGRDPRLVPVARPLPGAAHRGQLEEAAARGVRQAAALRLAGQRRRRDRGAARSARQGRHRRGPHRRDGAGRRHHRRGSGDDRPAGSDRRVGTRRERRRRSRLCINGHGRRQDPGRGREIRQ